MDWLTNNPIANMYGPDFLKLYATVCGLTLVVCWILMRSPISSIDPQAAREEATQKLHGVQALGAIVIVGLGGYKLLVALSRGHHNVLYLIAICFVSIALLFKLGSSRSTMSQGPS